MTAELSVVMTLAFYPRGGSAQVARYPRCRPRAMWDRCDAVYRVARTGRLGNERTNVLRWLNTESVDFTAALEAFAEGHDPMAVEVPIHPSFEDRPDVPDRIFANLDDDECRRQVSPWSDLLGRIKAPDVYHVHHLTHVNEAVCVHDEVPVLVHLHGDRTEDARRDSWRWPVDLGPCPGHGVNGSSQRPGELTG